VRSLAGCRERRSPRLIVCHIAVLNALEKVAGKAMGARVMQNISQDAPR